MRARHAGASLAALAFAFAAARLGHAQPFGVDSPTPSPPAPGGTEQAVVARYWELGRTRPFLAGTIEAGYAYLRPRFMAGYGRPFWSFAGVEAYPVTGILGIGQYAGVVAAIPGVSLRAGGRYFYPFSRSLLAPDESYSSTEFELLEGPAGDYLAYEAELTLTAPLFAGSIFGVLSGYRVSLVPDGYYVFEESLRVIMDPPWVWRARLGYLLALGPNGAIRVGAAGEVIGLPGRGEAVVRAGLLGSVAVSSVVEAQASFIPVILSPDNIGLAGGDFGQLGIKYTWATGAKPDPERLRRAVEESR